MAKIARYAGDLKAFASGALGTERTVFGDTAQSDSLSDNVNADFLRGWGIVGTNDTPSKQDFNGLGFTLSQLLSYLHQVGVPEWNGSQEYHQHSFVNYSGALYRCLTNNHVSAATPAADGTNWKLFLNAADVDYDNTTSGLTATKVQAAIDELKTIIESGIDAATVDGLSANEIGLGNVNQSWQDVSASRSHSTIYTNSTGRSIFVSIRSDGGARDFQVSSNASTWVTIFSGGQDGDGEGAGLIVPDGWSYRINGSCTIQTWAELR